MRYVKIVAKRCYLRGLNNMATVAYLAVVAGAFIVVYQVVESATSWWEWLDRAPLDWDSSEDK